MDNLAILKGLTIPYPAEPEQIRAQSARLRRRFFVYSLLASLAVGVVSGLTLWIWKGSGQWEGYWNIYSLEFLLMLLAPLSFIALGARSIDKHAQFQGRSSHTPAMTLRRAALAADETKAPAAAQQPELLEDGNFLTEPLRLGPFRRPDLGWQDTNLTIDLALSGGATALFLASFVLAAFGQVFVVDLLEIILWPVGIVAALIIWGWQQSLKKVMVTVDADGLQWKALYWRLPSRTLELAWQDARAFYTFDYEQHAALFWRNWRIYVLDAPAATLAWRVELPPKYARQTVAGDQAIHERLASVIVTRTGLTLRSLVAAANELAGKPFLPGASDPDAPVGVNEQPAQPHIPWQRRWYTLIPPLALLVLVPLAAWGIQDYYASYYGSLLAQVRAHHPLYYEANTDADRFILVDGAYEWQAAFAPNVYGDAAVEMTARLPKDAVASFGLILHADNDSERQVVFKLDLGGYWSLGAIDAKPGILIRTNTVNATPGAPNRLTVIMRGNQYICYVNDTFLAIYQEAQATTGQVGIFVDGAYVLDMATFSDFTVYPL